MKKCPKCLTENPDDVKRCSCLYRFGKDDTAPLINGMSPLENEKITKEQKKIKGQYFTAISTIIIIFGYIFLQALYIVPSVRTIFEKDAKELSARTKFMLNLCNFVQGNLLLSVVISLIMIFGLFKLAKYLKINKRDFLTLLVSLLGLIFMVEVTIFVGSLMGV